jgi:hypothetical protein
MLWLCFGYIKNIPNQIYDPATKNNINDRPSQNSLFVNDISLSNDKTYGIIKPERRKGVVSYER